MAQRLSHPVSLVTMLQYPCGVQTLPSKQPSCPILGIVPEHVGDAIGVLVVVVVVVVVTVTVLVAAVTVMEVVMITVVVAVTVVEGVLVAVIVVRGRVAALADVIPLHEQAEEYCDGLRQELAYVGMAALLVVTATQAAAVVVRLSSAAAFLYLISPAKGKGSAARLRFAWAVTVCVTVEVTVTTGVDVDAVIVLVDDVVLVVVTEAVGAVTVTVVGHKETVFLKKALQSADPCAGPGAALLATTWRRQLSLLQAARLKISSLFGAA